MGLAFRKKLPFFFGIAFGLFTLIAVFLFSNTEFQAVFRAGPNDPAKKAIADILFSLRELETQELSYVASGDNNAVLSIRSASGLLHRDFGELRSLFIQDKGLHPTLAHITALLEERVHFAEQVIAARTRGGKAPAEALVRNARRGQMSVQLATMLNELEQTSPRTTANHAARSDGLSPKLFYLVIAGFGTAFLFMTGIAALFIRNRFDSKKTSPKEAAGTSSIPLFLEEFKDSALFTLGPEGIMAQWSDSAERLYGFSATDVRGQHFSFIFPEKDIPLGKPGQCLKQAAQDGRSELIGWRRRKDGSLFLAHTIVVPLKGRSSELWGYSVLTRDITTIRQTEALLKKLSLTVEQTADLIIITDLNGKVEFSNKAVEEVTGFTRDEFFAGGIDLLINKEEDEKQHRLLWETVRSGCMYEAEIKAVAKNGEFIYLEEVVTPIKDDDGKVSHVVFTGTDVTPIKLLRSRLDFLASYDALTGLPNRELFAERLRRDMAAEHHQHSLMAVLAIDIDRFKYINEIYGLEAGNSILKQVAESLSVSVNKGDLVGRMGSDEFGIVLHDIRRPADIVLFVKMIMKNVPQIIMSNGEEISVTLTAGIAVYPGDGRDAALLMKNADTALSKAKSLGRNQYQFYTADMNLGILELVFMEQQLSDALKNKEYTLAFQPYCHLATRKVAGAEGLLKWKNEEFGQVSPTKFIPMLEETGMIIDVGKWVFETACMQIRDWTDRKIALPVSVNLSLNQFHHEYLVETVQKAIAVSGIDPRRLILEITESAFMKDQPFAVSVLKRLKALGVAISIDDFGTGYSSLSYLKKFPVDYIKIDQSFVKDVAADPDTTALVSAIISMAHSLKLITIAEGIETEEQWKILRLLKCDMGQGFYLSPALPPMDLEKFSA